MFTAVGAETCDQLFVVNLYLNLVVAIITSIIAISIIIKVTIIANEFFFTKYVPHTAKVFDDDIREI
jgi:hypothetical protein